MAKACPICRSRRWRKDRVSGSVVCEEGHILQDFRTENNEMDDGPRSMMFRRHLKKDRRRRTKRRTAGEPNPDFYRGEAKEYLRLQLFQLMLRVQVQVLTELWHLPPELETIAKDVWTCILSAYPLPQPPDSRYSDALEDDLDKQASKRKQADLDAMDDHKSDGGEHEDNKQSDVDSEILEKLSETSISADDERRGSGVRKSGHKRSNGTYYVQSETVLVVLVLSLWILRAPVMYSDIISLINEGRLPYLDFGSTSFIPVNARKHLSGDMRQGATWASVAPTASDLHERVKRCAADLAREYGLAIPDMNAAPILWKLTRDVGGDPTLYNCAQEVIGLAEMPLRLLPAVSERAPSSSSSSSAKDEDVLETFVLPSAKKRRKRNYIPRGAAGMPEMLLGSAVIVAHKLLSQPSEKSSTNLSHAEPRNDASHQGQGVHTNSTPSRNPIDFTAASDAEIDQYIDVAGYALLANRDEPADIDWLLRLFPTEPLSPLHREPDMGNATPLRPFSEHQSLVTHPTSHPADRISPAYLSFDGKDVAGELPVDMDHLVKELATLIGVSTDDLVDAVEDLEKTLAKVGKGMRGKQRFTGGRLSRISSAHSVSS